ncbi:response regulator transcription factor [Paraliomyxa miuraensis]|uniref:response regulator transcription factor n=1 Tax=Paraliomyxa miuraensis TaxID=376150 RepID=UPI00224E7A3F|nr:response regulator transcription factor [Paraliomyxa miuraensis]MCX4247106.1 response regulator transcription factor [Paraliomyxa miuraensis]
MQTHSLPDPLLALEPEVRALVVGDDPLVRQGFVARLADTAAGQASTHEDIPDALDDTEANLVLWDLGPRPVAPGAGTLDFPVPVVALAPHGTSTRELLAAGALGILRRDISTERLVHALGTVLQGLAVIDPVLLDDRPRTASRPEGPNATGVEVEALTTRETEVLELVAAGMSNKLIAEELGISAHTVKFHVNAILGKLDVHSRTEAVVKAMQLGVVLV